MLLLKCISCVEGGEKIQLVSVSDYKHKFGHTRDKLRVLINCGEHGRELISSEICLQFLHLCLTASSPAFSSASSSFSLSSLSPLVDKKSRIIAPSALSAQTLRFLLRNVEFFVIPLTSPWSRREVERGNYCNRKNKNKVDLNRNWDYLWQQSGSLLDDQYSGPAPFSEPESRAVRDIAVKLRPHMYINIHSGSRDLFTGPTRTEKKRRKKERKKRKRRERKREREEEKERREILHAHHYHHNAGQRESVRVVRQA